MNQRAPFRADHVGSLLRPAQLLAVRTRHAQGKVDAQHLRAAEDLAIAEVVAKQEEIGLKSVTDGEFRRENWSHDFFVALQGTEIVDLPISTTGQGIRTVPAAAVRGKVSANNHPMVGHLAYLLSQTSQTAKLTVPSPTMIVSASRDWRQIVDTTVYGGLEEFFADLAAAYRQFVADAYAAGCRYLQFDDVNLAYLCDAQMRERVAARGDDPDRLLGQWISVINAALAGRPADLAVTTHICRGNFKSQWFAQGGYDPIAERLFDQLDYDGFFLEYDSDRAGTFAPLRHLPKGNKRVVLGLVTSKTGALEPRDAILARIEEASQHADISQLCLSPQCGFASHEDGNTLTEAEQWDKLRRVVDIAAEVWADA